MELVKDNGNGNQEKSENSTSIHLNDTSKLCPILQNDCIKKDCLWFFEMKTITAQSGPGGVPILGTKSEMIIDGCGIVFLCQHVPQIGNMISQLFQMFNRKM